MDLKNHRILETYFKHESDDVLQIMDVNSIKFECNLVSGSFGNIEESHAKNEFNLGVPTNSQKKRSTLMFYFI